MTGLTKIYSIKLDLLCFVSLTPESFENVVSKSVSSWDAIFSEYEISNTEVRLIVPTSDTTQCQWVVGFIYWKSTLPQLKFGAFSS